MACGSNNCAVVCRCMSTPSKSKPSSVLWSHGLHINDTQAFCFRCAQQLAIRSSKAQKGPETSVKMHRRCQVNQIEGLKAVLGRQSPGNNEDFIRQVEDVVSLELHLEAFAGSRVLTR